MNLQNLQQKNGVIWQNNDQNNDKKMTKTMDNLAKEMKMKTIKFEIKIIKPNLCDYSDAYILVTYILDAYILEI